MKLTTKKQKTIWLVGIGVFCLAVFITTALIINANQRKNSPSNPFQPAPTPEPISLVAEQNEAITEIENILNTRPSIKGTDLVQKLIEQNKLPANQTDWKVYLRDAPLTTKEQITKLKEELKAILADLEKNHPDPTPPPIPEPDPERDPTPPQPRPDVRPSNQWEGILWDIRKFLETNPTSVQEIKDWVKEKKFPDPIKEAKIKLEGAPAEDLEKIPRKGSVPGIEEANEKTKKYKDWVQLSAVGDGNCFLNSFSVLLTGNANDTSLAMPLKVKLCLDYISNKGFTSDASDNRPLESVKDTLVGSGGFAKPGAWLDIGDIFYVALVLQRPLAVIGKWPNDPAFGEMSGKLGTYEVPEGITLSHPINWNATYKERWVIYNSGGHFQPLILPKKVK